MAQNFDDLSDTPASVTRLSTDDLSQVGDPLPLPPGVANENTAVYCTATDGGDVWATDGIGSVYRLQPNG